MVSKGVAISLHHQTLSAGSPQPAMYYTYRGGLHQAPQAKPSTWCWHHWPQHDTPHFHSQGRPSRLPRSNQHQVLHILSVPSWNSSGANCHYIILIKSSWTGSISFSCLKMPVFYWTGIRADFAIVRNYQLLSIICIFFVTEIIWWLLKQQLVCSDVHRCLQEAIEMGWDRKMSATIKCRYDPIMRNIKKTFLTVFKYLEAFLQCLLLKLVACLLNCLIVSIV